MKFIDDIFSLVWDIATFFYQLSRDARDIPIIGWAISTGFYEVYKAFWWLLTPIAQWYEWAAYLVGKIETVITWADLTEWQLDLYFAINPILEWFNNVWTNVYTIINTWWSSKSLTVQTWIANATQGFNDLVAAWGNFWNITWPEWTGKLANLRGEWDSFWVLTFPTLVDVQWAWEWWRGRLTEVGDLINSTLKVWFPFYDTEEKQRPDRINFFSNPLDWLANRLENWFWGEEEL